MIIGVVPLLALYWMYNSCNLTYRHNNKLFGCNFFALNIIYFQTMILLVGVDASSLLFAVIFLKCRCNINFLQVAMKITIQLSLIQRWCVIIKKAMTIFFSFQGLPFPMERVCNGLGFATGWHHSHHHYYHYLQNKYRYKYQQIIISIIITVKPS